MKKRIIALALAAALCLAAAPGALAGWGGLARVRSYGGFEDVPDGAWYAGYVRDAYEYGLIDGTSGSTFTPGGDIKVSQLAALAARLHRLYTAGVCDLENGSGGVAWYRPYVDYCLDNGIIAPGQFESFSRPALRREVAAVMARVLPGSALPAVNTVEDGAIPDVSMSDPDAGAIYLLYRAGIVNGNGDEHVFLPDTSIARKEVAAIIMRLALPGDRVSVTLTADGVDMSVPEGYTTGRRMPDFSFTSADGVTHSLYETLGEKRMVLINFWATWCPPCRAEFPAMEKAYEEYKDDIEVFALSCEQSDTTDVLTAFGAQNGITFPLGQDAGDLYAKFNTVYIPLPVVVDRFGVICMCEVGAQPYADSFRSLFELLTADSYKSSVILDGYPG